MPISQLARNNVILDVRCCLKDVLVAGNHVPTLRFKPSLVPSQNPPNGFAIPNGGTWRQVVRKMITCLRRKGYELDDVSIDRANWLLTKPVIKTSDYLRTNIYQHLDS